MAQKYHTLPNSVKLQGAAQNSPNLLHGSKDGASCRLEKRHGANADDSGGWDGADGSNYNGGDADDDDGGGARCK